MPLIDGTIQKLKIPEVHDKVLTSPGYRYRVLHGGRNGGKDWSAAAVAIEMAVRGRVRFLCTREVQNTIKESIKQLLEDTIHRLGYSKYFHIVRDEIVCKTTGAKFIFTGLQDINVDNVKSIESVDIVILGEAQSYTLKSHTVLNPTIRNSGSELWIIYNDQYKSDFICQFVDGAMRPDKMISARVSYMDLPRGWVSDEIWEMAEAERARNEERYNWIWLGMPRAGGRFFPEFGPHLIEAPSNIPAHECDLYGSLDYGDGQGEGASATSFGFWNIDKDGTPHRLFTYYRKGQTASTYAAEIVAMVKSFSYTGGLMPKRVFADPSIFFKARRLESGKYDKSVADIFIEHGLNLEQAKNERILGWRTCREYFVLDDEGKNQFYYWEDYNDDFEGEMETLKHKELPNGTISDDCEKVNDHSADECRYFLVEAMGMKSRKLAKRSRVGIKTAIRRHEWHKQQNAGRQ